MSKGTRPRPFTISQEQFGNNIEAIFGKKPPKERYIPPPLPTIVDNKGLNAYNNNIATVDKDDKWRHQ